MPRMRWLLAPVIALAVPAVLAGCHDSTPAVPTCTYSLTSPTVTFTAAGGHGTVGIATGASCAWTAAIDAAWVTLLPAASGVGPGTLQFDVTPNTDTASRRATLTIGGQSIGLAQDGRTPCQYVAAPTGFDVPAAGGTGAIAVTAGAGCPWTAVSSDAWLVVTSGSAGAGDGSVGFSASVQTALSSRQATITVGGQVVMIRQSGAAPPPPPPIDCQYSVSPTEIVEHWHGTGFSLSITTSAGCSWTASPSDSWITVSRTAGQGSAAIDVSHEAFTADATRRAAVEVRWPSPTAGQNVWVTQEGCRYGFDQTPSSFPASGGTRRVTVVTQPLSASCSIGCPWTATSGVPWIHVTSSMPRAGDDMFSYEVDANPGSARSGTLTIAGRALTVTQAGI
jgi:Putative binding domain, N-terminal/Viral BACON domain